MTSVESLKSLTLNLPPSCIEIWPADERYAVVGTYNLEKQEPLQETEQAASQRRNGSLILLQIEEEDAKISQTLPTSSAVLDIHFANFDPHVNLFGIATSTGAIGFFQLKFKGNECSMEHLSTIQYFSEDEIITAFAFHPSTLIVGMTLSSGKVYLGKVHLGNKDEEPSYTECMVTTPHNLEVWTLAFLPEGLGLYSGGDDSVLQFIELTVNSNYYFDGRTEPKYGDIRRTPWNDKKMHGAGVTAILPLKVNDEEVLLLTGSYDDHIRLMRVTNAGRRTILAELNLGGGVWRLKRLDEPVSTKSTGFLLLASCMHAGARILKLSRDNDSWHFEVLAKFEEHKSMNYGSDCQSSLNAEGQRTFITTSFYDKLLCLWRY